VKIFTTGNVLNNSYNMTRFLRAKGVDAELFLDDSTPGGQNYPWWEHSELSPEELPEWIHYWHVTSSDFLRFSSRFKAMAAEFSKCDIALVTSWGPILSEAAGVPSVFYSYGTDLMAAHTRRELSEGFRRVLSLSKPGLRSLLLGLRQRHALKSSTDVVAIMMGWQIESYVRPLGLIPKMEKTRLAWRVEDYESNPIPDLVRRYEGYDLVFFMLTRHSWRSVWSDIKGNDKFIRAFAAFVRERQGKFRLICVEKGPDVSASKALIEELSIGEYTEWVPEMNKDALRGYYSLPNGVVVDQFWHDEWYRRYPADKGYPRIGFGSGSIEAMCARRPLITVFFDHEFYEGAKPPVLNAFSVSQIRGRLHEVVDMGSDGRRALADAAHDFVMRYHDWSAVTDRYIALLERTFKRRSGRASPAKG
jgi:glycosyltransferase involved in cell wall biosynthesis